MGILYNAIKEEQMDEKNLKKEILLFTSQEGHRLFRNNTGTGWQGKLVSRVMDTLVLKYPRPLRAGLCKGSSDLIGWTKVLVTKEMVGKTIAVFTGVELKTKTGRPTEEQINFKEVVNNNNGIGMIVRTIEEYKKGLEKWINQKNYG